MTTITACPGGSLASCDGCHWEAFKHRRAALERAAREHKCRGVR